MEKQINIGFIVFAFIFFITLPFHPYAHSYLIKALPAFIASMSCFCMLKKPFDALFMGMGFLLCMSGDIFLDINREVYFVQGLASFLVGHIFFSLVFARKFHYSFPKAIKACLVFIYLGILSFFIIPHLGSLLIPVTAYMFIIGIMGISACFIDVPSPYILIGASLFVFSDSIIAISKFVLPFNQSLYFIIFSYYSALFFIQYGIRKEYGKTKYK